MDLLDITRQPMIDDCITKLQHHTYYPYTQVKNGEEVRIVIQNQDLAVLPSQAYVYVELQFKRAAADGKFKAGLWLYINAAMFCFDQIRYGLNSMEIHKCMNPGITTLRVLFFESQ